MRRYALPGVAMLLLLAALHTFTLASGIPAELAVETLAVTNARGDVHAFRVHIADTPEARRRGLMFVTRMAPDEGMLFDFGTPGPVSMWMKNTPLSLDMLFIEADGRILSIAEKTPPLSTRTIPAGGNVLAVLEVLGGTAEKLGIRPGDRVDHRLFRDD